MATYTQGNRPLSVKTPLGPDKLLLIGFHGVDAISQPFSYRLDLLAENATDIPFDKLLGQPCTVTFRWDMDNSKQRFFNGICARVSQGPRDAIFTQYHIELVPAAWLLTRKAQSRIFQHMSVQDILKKVLTGIKVTWKLQGSFEPRDYCVQYRETDFNFMSRLMEEEGIFYFFKHEDGSHEMIVGNHPGAHLTVDPQPTVPFEEKLGGPRDELRIVAWEKIQEVRSGKYTLWDHSFELPYQNLEADKLIQDSVSVGGVSHKLKVANNDKLEIYDFPGEYAQRFDGIDKGGGDQPAELQKIFQDNKRTVEIRMQEEAVHSLEIQGRGNCRQFVSGHKFSLERHFNANGDYVLTSVSLVAQSASSDYFSGESQMSFATGFTCIPVALPFRPPRRTPKPLVQGTQSAVVVGPADEEIFTDKYSRVKVQFPWDREGKKNQDSSCWIRVTTLWAGKQWGMIHIPRIGQEVLVSFLEGDPDQPIIVGSVYNADMMPPGNLPPSKIGSGVKSRSTLKGTPDNFNAIEFDDTKGKEALWIHAEKDQHIEVEHDETHTVGVDRKKSIGRNEQSSIGKNRTETVGEDEKISIGGNRSETVEKNETITVGGDRTMSVGGKESLEVSKDIQWNITADEKIQVGGDSKVEIAKNASMEVGKKFSLTAEDEIELKTGSATLLMKKDGTIEIEGNDISIKGSGKINVKAGGDIAIKGSKVATN
jgi:type VI secretion system secreted protein VgrG